MIAGTRDASQRRIVLHDELASGGTATVHIACLVDPPAAPRVVAVKRLKDGATDPELVTMLFDEARCAKRIRHPNVVPIIDAIVDPSGVMLVFEYVHGETLSRLFRACLAARGRIPVGIAAAVVTSVLEGLDAAHEATDVDGTPLHIVHRDVSPQNIMLGADGVTQLVDFGIAKAVGRLRTTRDGAVRGKIGYLAPEQLNGKPSRQSDVFSAAVVLWELLVGRRLYSVKDPLALLEAMQAPPPAPSSIVPEVPQALDRIVMRGLARDAQARYATAREMAQDLFAAVRLADRAALSAFVIEHASAELARRQALVTAALSGGGAVSRDARENAGAASPGDGDATERLAVASATDTSATDRGAPGAAPASPPPRSTRRAGGVIAIGMAVVVLLIVLVAALRMRTAETAAATEQPPLPNAAPATSSSSSPAASEAALPLPDAATVSESVDAHAHAPPPKRRPRPAAATVDCDPPYTLSEDGSRRVPKRECFR